MSKSYRIAVIPGDGTGPEVVAEGLKALKATAGIEGFSLELETYDLGGERYLKTGETLPPNVLKELKGFDSILLGAIGHPDVKMDGQKAATVVDNYRSERPEADTADLTK